MQNINDAANRFKQMHKTEGSTLTDKHAEKPKNRQTEAGGL